MSINRGLIQNDKYFTMVGQLHSVSRDKYGDTSVTTITTVNCLVYQQENGESLGAPAIGKSITHFALVPSSLSVADGDFLSSVVDKFGQTFLSNSRVVKRTAYGDWQHGSRFIKLDLDLDL